MSNKKAVELTMLHDFLQRLLTDTGRLRYARRLSYLGKSRAHDGSAIVLKGGHRAAQSFGCRQRASCDNLKFERVAGGHLFVGRAFVDVERAFARRRFFIRRPS